jgi:hypothetical protein
MTPAEELHAAAALLRNRLVSAATEGPWYVVEYDHLLRKTYEFEAGLGTTPDDPDVAGHGYEGGGFTRLCDAQYVAAMHPGVGAALADWLDAYAVHLASTHPGWQETVSGPPLIVARSILGSQP